MAQTQAPSEAEVGAIDLTDRRHYQAGVPYHLFAALRSAGPVHRHHLRLPDGTPMPYWSVVGHEEINVASRDSVTFSSTDGPGLLPDPMYREMGIMVALDPPDHLRLRRLISAGFTPRMIARLEENIASRAERILDDVEASLAAGHAARQAAGQAVGEAESTVDFVAQIAFPLPMHVIADIVGIPETDRAWVFDRASRLLQAVDTAAGISEAEYAELMMETYDYAHRLSELKRREPTDDIWSLLARAEVDDAALTPGEGEGGDTQRPPVGSLSGAELDAFFMILTIAGSETTRNALAQGVRELVRHPNQVAALRADPSLLPAAAEEVLRWSSPVLMFGRTATRDVELGGQLITAGERVVLWYPSANRDERVFDRPEAFDITRSPNPHVAFGGGGAHFCLGANLARTEIQVVLGALVRRFDQIEVVGHPAWLGAGPVHNVGVSLTSLHVRLSGRPEAQALGGESR